MTCAENTERNLRNYYEDESHLSGQTLHFHCSSTASKALRRPHQCLYEQKDFLKCNITTDQDVFMQFICGLKLLLFYHACMNTVETTCKGFSANSAFVEFYCSMFNYRTMQMQKTMLNEH